MSSLLGSDKNYYNYKNFLIFFFLITIHVVIILFNVGGVLFLIVITVLALIFGG